MSLEFALVAGGLGLLWYLTYSGANTTGEANVWFKSFYQLSSPWTTVILLGLCVSIADNTAGVHASIVNAISIMYRWATILSTVYTSLWFIMFFREALFKLKDTMRLWKDK